LCLGEGTRGDIGCPTYAPYVNPANSFVGIGTNLPSSTLHVNGVGGSALTITRDGTSAMATMYMDTTGFMRVSTTGGGALYSSMQPALRWYSNGKVFIGGSAGTASTTLQVSGTLQVADGGETCDANRAGAMKWTGTEFQVCY